MADLRFWVVAVVRLYDRVEELLEGLPAVLVTGSASDVQIGGHHTYRGVKSSEAEWIGLK